jgi:uroporphyrinogen III methyltransferase / synthase
VAETARSPLAGKRIVITRASAQSEALAGELAGRSAIPIVLPLISFADPEDFAPLDAALGQVEQFDWIIFTSAQAVRAVVTRSQNLGHSLIRTENKLGVAAVGPATARAAKQVGLSVKFVANTHNGVALAEELGEQLRERNVFLPRSDRGNPDLPAALRRHGARLTEVIAYRTLRPSEIDQRNLRRMATGEADAILFFSPSAVHYFSEVFGKDQLHALENKLAVTAVGQVTAGALREAGVQHIVLAEGTTAESVVEALENYFARTLRQSSTGARRG